MDFNIDLLIQDLLKIEPPKTAQICTRITKKAQFDVGFEEYELSPDRRKKLEEYFTHNITSNASAFVSLISNIMPEIIRAVETGEYFKINDPRLRNNPNEQLQSALDQFENYLNREITKKRNEEIEFRADIETPNVDQDTVVVEEEAVEEEVGDGMKIDEPMFEQGAPYPGKGEITWTVNTGRKGAPVHKDFSLALKFWKDPANIKWIEEAARKKASKSGRGDVNDLVARSMHIMSNAIADKLSFYSGDDAYRNESGTAYYPLKMMSKGEFPQFIRDTLSNLPEFNGIVDYMRSKGFNLDRGYHGEEQSAFARALIGTPYEDAILKWVWDNPNNDLIRRWIASGVTPQLKRDAIAGKGLSLDWLAENRTDDGDGTAGDIATEQGYTKQQYDFSEEQKSELYSEFLKDRVIPYFDNKINSAEDIMGDLADAFRNAAISGNYSDRHESNFRDTANIISEVTNTYLPNFTDVFFDASGEFIQNMSKYIDVKHQGNDTVITFINPDNMEQRLPVVLRNYKAETGSFDGIDMRILSLVKSFGSGKIGDENIGKYIINSFNKNMQTAGGASGPDELSKRIKDDLSRNGYNSKQISNFIDAFVNSFAKDDYINKDKIENALEIFPNLLGTSSIDDISNESVLKEKLMMIDHSNSNNKRFYKNLLITLAKRYSGDIRSLSERDKRDIAMHMYMGKYATTMSGKELEGALSRSVRDSQLLPFLAMVNKKRTMENQNLTDEEKADKLSDDREALQFILDAFNFDYRRYGMPFKNFGYQNNKFYENLTGEKKQNYKIFWDMLGVDIPQEIQQLSVEFPSGIPVKSKEIDEAASAKGISSDELKDHIKTVTKNIVKQYRDLLPMKRADHELYLKKIACINNIRSKLDYFINSSVNILGYNKIHELNNIKKNILGD